MFLIFFRQFTLLFQCSPDRIASLWVHAFNAVVELGNGGPLGVVLVGTVLQGASRIR